MDIIAVATDSNTVLLIDLSTYMKPSGSPPTAEAELGSMATEIQVGQVTSSRIATNHCQAITSLAFSPDGRQLAIGEASGRILLVELEETSVCSQKHLSTAASSAVSFLTFVNQGADSVLLVGCDNNNELYLQDATSDSKFQTIRLPTAPGARNPLDYEKDSNLVLVGCQARKSLMAFHLALKPTPCFDFVSEYILPEPILDIAATRDIMTFKGPHTDRCISLYISQADTKSVCLVPFFRLYPTDHAAYPVYTEPQQGPLSVSQGMYSTNEAHSLADDAFLTELFSRGTASTPSDAAPAPLVQEDGSLSLTNLFLAHESSSKPKSRQSKAAGKPDSRPVSTIVQAQDPFPSLTPKESIKARALPDSEASATPPSKPTLAQVVARNPEDVASIVKREVSGAAQQNAKDIAKLGGQLTAITRDIKSLPASLNQSLAEGINNTLRDCVQQQIPQVLDDRFAIAFKQFLSGKVSKARHRFSFL